MIPAANGAASPVMRIPQLPNFRDTPTESGDASAEVTEEEGEGEVVPPQRNLDLRQWQFLCTSGGPFEGYVGGIDVGGKVSSAGCHSGLGACKATKKEDP